MATERAKYIKISDMIPASELPPLALLEVSNPVGSEFDTNSVTPTLLGRTIVKDVEYADLLDTTSSTIVGAINELKASGGGSGTTDVISWNRNPDSEEVIHTIAISPSQVSADKMAIATGNASVGIGEGVATNADNSGIYNSMESSITNQCQAANAIIASISSEIDNSKNGNVIVGAKSATIGDSESEVKGNQSVILGGDDNHIVTGDNNVILGGQDNVANGSNLTMTGTGLRSSDNSNQFIFGMYNEPIEGSTVAEIVGGGTSDEERVNIRTLDYSGNMTLAGSLANGEGAIASGAGAHAHGAGAQATGSASHAEGQGSMATGLASHAEGAGTRATEQYAHAEGAGSTASGMGSHVEGMSATASGAWAHAEGVQTASNGSSSHAEGTGTQANADFAHAEGHASVASGTSSHAEGEATGASEQGAHSEGLGSQATSHASHAEGIGTQATGVASHTEGQGTQAAGTAAHAQGIGTVANGGAQFALGILNIPSDDLAVVVGNGELNYETEEMTNSNCHTLGFDGTAWFAKEVYVGSTSGTNKDAGSKKLMANGDSSITIGSTTITEQQLIQLLGLLS